MLASLFLISPSAEGGGLSVYIGVQRITLHSYLENQYRFKKSGKTFHTIMVSELMTSEYGVS